MTDKSTSPGQDLQEELRGNIRKSQEAVIDAITTWAEAVQSLTPKIPSVQVPGADELPRPEEVVASAYDFADQLLRSQRQFAEELLKATNPLLPGGERSMTAGGPLPGPGGGGGGQRPKPHDPKPKPGQGPSQPS